MPQPNPQDFPFTNQWGKWEIMVTARSSPQPCPGGVHGDQGPPYWLGGGGPHRFSRSGMLRFLVAKHIFRGITLRSRGPWCWGEPESSLPLRLGDCGAAPSHGRSDTSEGFLM